MGFNSEFKELNKKYNNMHGAKVKKVKTNIVTLAKHRLQAR